MNDKYKTILEWGSTALIILGVAFQMVNWYPYNLFAGLLGSAGFMFCGMLWQKWSVALVNLLVGAFYMGGVIYFLIQ